MSTPYGGRLVYQLPGGSKLVVHLKDKSQVRGKKRWSQIMYMYYLLGYRVFGDDAVSQLDGVDDECQDYDAYMEAAADSRASGFGKFLQTTLDPSVRLQVGASENRKCKF